MSDYQTIKNILLNNNGKVAIKDRDGFNHYKTFGVLTVGKNKHVVALPEKSDKPNTADTKSLFYGILWKIDFINNIPTLTGDMFHTFNERAANFKMAIRKFNTKYRNHPFEQGEIVEVFSVAN